MSVVVLVRACPARPATVTSGTPAAICIVILVCRNECKSSDFLFAYGNLISRKAYLRKNLCDIIHILRTNEFSGNHYCLGKTKKGNPKHPLYQKSNTPFVQFSIDGHTYSEIVYLGENKCAILEYSEDGKLLLETIGIHSSNTH